MGSGERRTRVAGRGLDILRAPWPLTIVWVLGATVFGVRAAHALSSGSSADFYAMHVGVHSFLTGGNPYPTGSWFVYPPSAGLLLGPFGAGSFEASRDVFFAVSIPVLLGAASICLHVAGLRWRGLAGALTLVALGVFMPVYLTLGFGNVNSLIFLAEAAGFALMLRGRWVPAGAVVGLSLAIKPILVPLLLLPALRRQWRSIAVAVGIPLVLSGIAVVVNTHASRFVTYTIPFLLRGGAANLQGRNVSLAGAAKNLGVPHMAGSLISLVVAVGVIWLAASRWKQLSALPNPDPLRSVETACLLLLGTFLCFSQSWHYYGIFLLPMLFAAVDPRALARHPVVWLGVALIGSPDHLFVHRFYSASLHFKQVRPTLAFLLILAGAVLACRRQAGRTLTAQIAPRFS